MIYDIWGVVSVLAGGRRGNGRTFSCVEASHRSREHNFTVWLGI
jgi:hypothetical protein